MAQHSQKKSTGLTGQQERQQETLDGDGDHAEDQDEDGVVRIAPVEPVLRVQEGHGDQAAEPDVV